MLTGNKTMNGDSLFIFQWVSHFLLCIFFCEEIKRISKQYLWVSQAQILMAWKNSLKRKKENGIVDFLFFFVKNWNDCELIFALVLFADGLLWKYGLQNGDCLDFGSMFCIKILSKLHLSYTNNLFFCWLYINYSNISSPAHSNTQKIPQFLCKNIPIK